MCELVVLQQPLIAKFRKVINSTNSQNMATGTHKSLIVFLIFFTLTPLLHAQHTEPQQYLRLNKNYLLSYATDAGAVATSPATWNSRQWIGATAATGAILLLWTQDDHIRNFTRRNTFSAGHEMSTWFFDPLTTWYFAAMAGGMYFYGLTAGNPEAETAALLTTKAVVITAAYSTLLKGAFQRERPFEGNPPDPDQWHGPLAGFKHGAFPSRHASMSFAAAAALSSYYNDHVWVGITGYTLATLVSLSQLHEDQHWASDVLAGAALGYAIGKLVANNNRKAPSKVAFQPAFDSRIAGVAISFTFD
jgi:membrane-associated phospholipid phosphatase